MKQIIEYTNETRSFLIGIDWGTCGEKSWSFISIYDKLMEDIRNSRDGINGRIADMDKRMTLLKEHQYLPL